MRLIKRRECKICHSEFLSRREAEQCEAQGFKPRYSKGQEVKIESNVSASKRYRIVNVQAEGRMHEPVYEIRILPEDASVDLCGMIEALKTYYCLERRLSLLEEDKLDGAEASS